MSNALMRGRTLVPQAVKIAIARRKLTLVHLNAQIDKAGSMLGLTRKERHQWRHLAGRMAPKDGA